MASMAVTGQFDMGRVVSRAAGAVRRNLGLFAMLAFLLQFLPALLIRGFEPIPTSPVPGTLPSFSGPTLLLSLLSLALYYIMQASVTHIAVADLKGERPTLGPALNRSVRLILPLIGLAFVTGFGVIVGMIFLIVPGIILALMWSVATPVLIEEGLGVFASLGRSRALTKGARGSIFLFGLAIGLAFMLFFTVVLTVFGTSTSVTGAGFAAMQSSLSGFGPGAVVLALVNAVTVVVLTALVAAIYVELRYVKEGTTADSIAAVFD